MRALTPEQNTEILDDLSLPFFGYEYGDEFRITDDTINHFLGLGYDLNGAALSLWGANTITEALTLVEDYLLSTLIAPSIDLTISPININYKTALKSDANLYPDRVFYKGECREVFYYREYDEATKIFTIPALKVTITYDRDSTGLITDQGRETLRQYYTINGDTGRHSSTHTKHYDGAEKIREIKRRRQNLIDVLELTMLGLIIQTDLAGLTVAEIMASGLAFMVEYESELQHFVNTGLGDIVTAITADVTYSWLDNITSGTDTIRDYMVGEFDLSV